MPLPELTKGFWQRFFNDERPEKPVLQIMDGRPIQKTNAPPDDRFRFRISDGDFYYSTCLTQTQLSERIAKDKLNVGHSIIRLLDYNGSILNAGGKVTFCMGNYEILAKSAPMVGNPVAHSGNANDYPPPMSNAGAAQQSVGNNRPTMQPAAAPAAAQSNFGGNRDSNRPQTNQQEGRFQGGSRGGVLAGGSAGSQNITPISSVTPYASKWKICGIVTAKEDIRTIKTARGDTKVFNFEMVDQEGTDVRVGAWNELADKFHSMINKGQMYYLSGATVKQTNKRFNTTKHEYELSLRSDSEIVACIDRAQFAAPRIRFQFVKFNQLQNCIGTNVDVIGVVQTVEDIVPVPSKKTNETLNKRDVHLVDDSGTMVTLTLWNEQARTFSTNSQEHPVIALKGVSVREFRDCVSLSMMGSTKMEMSPDFPEAYDLSGWYDEQGANIQQQVASISRDNSAGRDGMSDMRMIGIAEALQLGNRGEEKGAYFNVKAMIASMKTENALYKACYEEGCKKKVIEVNGMLRCEKCNKQSLNFKYVTLLSAEMTDLSGTHWVTMFEESAQKLLGKSAAELGTLLENDKDAYYAVFEKVRFNSFIFRIRSKAETYNDEQRIKWTVYDVRPVPWDQYIDTLNKTIEAVAAL